MSNVFSRRRSRVRATRHDCKDVIFKSRTADGRPARGGAEFPSLRTFSFPARGDFHESENRDQKRTRQIEENPTAGARDLRTKHPRKRRATKIRSENANACDAPEARGIARNGAELRNCVSLLCPLFAVLGVNSSKRDAGMRLGVSGASRCYF